MRSSRPSRDSATKMRTSIALALGVALLSSTALAQSDKDLKPGDWPRYARDLGGSHYSPLAQITVANVSKLQHRLVVQGAAGGRR